MEEDGQEPEAVDAFRKAIAKRIALESDRLVDELFAVAYDPEIDAKVKLSAISMLLERSLPKMGVQHTREDEIEERGSRKSIREEIEKLLLGDDEDEDDEQIP